jgi:formylmethanofuran dehydrogenase subunit A
MKELLIKNGNVFDPLNGVIGEKMDICIKNGKIVDSVSSKAKVIDASGKIVMPGGVDIHSHIAGSKVNIGRALRPEDHIKDFEVKTSVKRSGVGHSIPSTFTTGYRYAEMGYTTVFEPASPPLKARHTHDELNDIPIVDKANFPLFGNNWIVMEYLRDKKIEECAAYVAWMLNATKGYAIKVVNPGGVEAWHWGKNVDGIDDVVPYFEITPREIIRGLCKVNKLLNLPHSVHLHTNNLGKPGNYDTTIATMDCVKDLASNDKPILHITHVQFTGRKGTSWINVGSGAPEIANYVNKHKHITIDIGQIIFTDTTWMTADGPAMYMLHLVSGRKWFNADVEIETGAGVVPALYRPYNYVNAIQWGIGLELALLIENPWQVFLTTDHPNGGPFTSYPRVIAWLMSKKAREKTLEKLNKTAKRRLNLPGIEREYDFNEIAIATRAGTAKALGLKDKGHLGVGADADVSIYDLDVSKINPSSDYKKVRKKFRRALYTIKGGKIVVKNGEVVDSCIGRTYWVNAQVSQGLMDKVVNELKEKFKEYYTIQFENYPIKEDYLALSEEIKTFSKV